MLRPSAYSLMRSAPRRVVMLLAILSLSFVLALPAGAVPQRERRASRAAAGPNASRPATWASAFFWGLACQLGPAGLCRDETAIWEEIGCLPDPSGHCAPAATPQGDIGCLPDPSGGQCSSR
jgi:hypothetical protein